MGQSGAVPPAGAAPPTAPRQSKGGKVKGGTDKRKRPGLPYSGAQPNLSSLSPDQMNQMQLEEAIKESSNPAMKLKRLKSPLSFKSCLLNILLLAVLTIIVAFVFVWIFKVDRFNPIYIAADMLNDFGITKFFVDLGKRIANLFSGKGWTLDVIKMLINFIR
ncbi:MAG: hypothetical protein LBP26_01735 [Clostridiales bacterium]|nr:hypothetical protein [Clostridiales bacterium]